jgi:hypothetical protein
MDGKGEEHKDPFLDFYYGEQPTNANKYISQILFDLRATEHKIDHISIEWLFPTNEKSQSNKDAPVFNFGCAQAFRETYILQTMMIGAFVLILHKYDMECLHKDGNEFIEIVKSKNWNDQSLLVYGTSLGILSHWELFTRIMRCLRIAGLQPIATLLQLFLSNCYYAAPSGFVPDGTWKHWNTAVEGKLELPIGINHKPISTKAGVPPRARWSAMHDYFINDSQVQSILQHCRFINGVASLLNSSTAQQLNRSTAQQLNSSTAQQLNSSTARTVRGSTPEFHANAPHIIQFYYNEISRKMGNDFFYSIFEDAFVFESTHDYIQFFFPSPVKSLSNPNAPLFDSRSIALFQSDPTLKKYMICAFIRMTIFYDLLIDLVHTEQEKTLRLDIPVRWKTESNINTNNPKNHNYLRLSRIMISLTFAGLKHIARALQTFLIEKYSRLPNIYVPQLTLQYWRDALNEEKILKLHPLTDTPSEFEHMPNPNFKRHEEYLKGKIKDNSLSDRLFLYNAAC